MPVELMAMDVAHVIGLPFMLAPDQWCHQYEHTDYATNHYLTGITRCHLAGHDYVLNVLAGPSVGVSVW